MSKAKYSESKKAPAKTPAKTTKNAKSTPQHKERKAYLTAALLLVLVTGIIFTLMLFNERRLIGVPWSDVPWYAWMMIVTAVLDVVAAAALWYWKKWGLYLYLGSAFASAVFMALGGMIGAGFGVVAPAAIVGYLVSLNWRQFE